MKPICIAPCALALAALLGCAQVSGPSPSPLEPSASQNTTLELPNWWARFGDALLSQRIEQALRSNGDLQRAAARLREAQAQWSEAQGARLPSLVLGLEGERAHPSAASNGAPQGPTLSQQRAGLVTRFDLDLWGQLRATDQAAGHRLQAEQWARLALAWSLSTQVAELHLSLAALQRQIEISSAVIEGRRGQLAMRDREHAAGASSEFEQRRAQAELAGAESQHHQLLRQQLAAARALALLLGVDDFNPATPPLQGEASLPRLPQGELRELLARRPDVRQAEQQLAASQADLRAARAGSLPALQFSGRLGSDARELGQLFKGPGMAWSLLGSLTQSLFDGGRSAARVSQADARRDGQRALYTQALQRAAAEAHEAIEALVVEQQQLEASQRRSTATARAWQLAQRGRALGAISPLDALDSERQHFQAQLDEVEALRKRRVGELGVIKALAQGPGLSKE
ncbi:MAG: TolC family protein [Inhella sp.]